MQIKRAPNETYILSYDPWISTIDVKFFNGYGFHRDHPGDPLFCTFVKSTDQGYEFVSMPLNESESRFWLLDVLGLGHSDSRVEITRWLKCHAHSD